MIRNSKITTTRVERKHELKLDGEMIRDAISQELAAQGEDRIPANATVTFWVPGGADWSNTSFDIDEENPVTIRWSIVEEIEQ